MIIAIDGPAAAGKGTLAKRLAVKLNFAYLDTGSLYRAVGLQMLRAGLDPSDALAAEAISSELDSSLFTDPDLRLETTASAASQVASIASVRVNLLNFQRNFAGKPPESKAGAVLDGRDIGTVVCPDASVKLYVTASAAVRARRRYDEIIARGDSAEYADVLADVEARDARDMGRIDAPLKPAEDAHLLDTSELDIDAVFSRVLAIIADQHLENSNDA